MRVESYSTQINNIEQLSQSSRSSLAMLSAPASQSVNEEAYKLELSPVAQFSNNDINELYKHIQDSNSLLQTAEEGASETESLLTRIQKLVEQASSEELGDTELESIQKEIDELVSEIDHVALLNQNKIKQIQDNSSLLSGNNQLKLGYLPQDLADKYGSINNNVVNKSAFNINCGDDSLQIILQIGPNQGQTMTIDIRAMNSKKLGLAGIDVTTRENAVKSLKTIDKAIESVSSQRAGLGATIRCLEHTINYLTSMRDNLADAESRIRDVDMAKEYSEYLKNSIQSKIAGAILAHANQRPKMVLKLLGII